MKWMGEEAGKGGVMGKWKGGMGVGGEKGRDEVLGGLVFKNDGLICLCCAVNCWKGDDE